MLQRHLAYRWNHWGELQVLCSFSGITWVVQEWQKSVEALGTFPHTHPGAQILLQAQIHPHFVWLHLSCCLSPVGFKWICKCTPISNIKNFQNKLKKLSTENRKGCLCFLPQFLCHVDRIKGKDQINCSSSLGPDLKICLLRKAVNCTFPAQYLL